MRTSCQGETTQLGGPVMTKAKRGFMGGRRKIRGNAQGWVRRAELRLFSQTAGRDQVREGGAEGEMPYRPLGGGLGKERALPRWGKKKGGH